jgi:hypothetical protein
MGIRSLDEVLPESIIALSLLAASCLFLAYVVVHIRNIFGREFIKQHGWVPTILLAMVAAAVGSAMGRFLWSAIENMLQVLGY